MKTASELKVNDVIMLNGKLCKIEETNLKGAAKAHKTIEAKMYEIIENKLVEHTFHQEDKIEDVSVMHQKATYSYKNGEDFCFMDQETFETYTVKNNIIADNERFLKEEDTYTLLVYEGNPIGIMFPDKVKLKVTIAPPGLKGEDTYKGITLENGMDIDAPQFIEEGDTIELCTKTGKYLDRIQ